MPLCARIQPMSSPLVPPLQLLILSENGGKVWAGIEKATGQSFTYHFNNVVKFRDVAMRGPWTREGVAKGSQRGRS